MSSGKSKTGVPLRDYVDTKDVAQRQEISQLRGRVELLQRYVDELRLEGATHLGRDSFDAFTAHLSDDLTDYPSKSEVRAQLDTVQLTVAAVNQRVADFTSQQEIRASGYMTKEAFTSYTEKQQDNAEQGRRAIVSAWVAVGLALVGWVLTGILTFAGH